MADITRRGRPKKVSDTTNMSEEPVVTAAVETPKTESSEVVSPKSGTQEYTVEVIRDYDGKIDPFYLSKKDPDYSYRFLRDEHKNLSMKTGNLLFQKGGWQMVDRKHALRLGIKESEISPDGLVRRGDTVLAFMPMKLYEEKEAYKVKNANAPISQIRRLVKEGDKDVGGKEIHDTMRGIQTQKQLGM